MRAWNKLGLRQKFYRLYYILIDFFKYSIWGDYKRGGICGVYHWIRCHTWNRYHIINIRGVGDYDYGWIDRDNAMYLACFAILTEFVEKEDPKVGLRTIKDYEYPDMGENERENIEKVQLVREQEIRALYDWWTVGRVKEHAEANLLLDKFDINWTATGGTVSDEVAFKNWSERHHELEDKDEEMLMRLMKVRTSLWT